jgi:hypothetical protein
MKVFQALHSYPPYIPHFEKKYQVENLSFEEHRKVLLKDRFYALHILKPCLDLEPNGFYALWDYEKLQLKWAKEKGWNETDLKKILFAQIEDFQPDVFYTTASDDLTSKELDDHLTNSITRVCWSAAPGRSEEAFKAYKTRLTNYPGDVRPLKEAGFRSDLFQPSYDNGMVDYAKNEERPIDLFFYGQYRAGFDVRNRQIEELLQFKKENPKLNIKFKIQYKEKEHIYINIPYIRRFFRKVYPPKIVRKYSEAPVFGLDLYEDLSKSKIVFNAGVDFTKNHKVNMRNFEVLGCGAHMISDEGIYPDGFEKHKHFSVYKDMDECIAKIKHLLDNSQERLAIAKSGNEMVKQTYTKEKQWLHFQQIVESL